MDCYTFDDYISFGSVLLCNIYCFHCLECVHPIDHFPDDGVNIVQLTLLFVNDVELTLVCVGMLLGHCYHSSTIELHSREPHDIP